MKFEFESHYDIIKEGSLFIGLPIGACALPAVELQLYCALLSLREIEWGAEGRPTYTNICKATNPELAALMNVEARTISRSIKRLTDKGLIICATVGNRQVKIINSEPLKSVTLGAAERLQEAGSNYTIMTPNFARSCIEYYGKNSPQEGTKNVADEGFDRDTFRSPTGTENQEGYKKLSPPTQKIVPSESAHSTREHHNKQLNNKLIAEGDEEIGGQEDFVGTPSNNGPTGSYTPPPYSPPSQELSELDPGSFGITAGERTVKSEAELKRLKGIKRLELNPVDAKPNDIVSYFNRAFLNKYGIPARSSKSIQKTELGIISSAFVKLYPPERLTELIDGLIDLYDDLGLDNSKYPRPSLQCLTQKWLMNLVDAKLSDNSRKAETRARIAEEAKEGSMKRERPPLSVKFLNKISEALGEEFEKLFYEKWSQGRFDNSTWIDNLELPADQLKELILNG